MFEKKRNFRSRRREVRQMKRRMFFSGFIALGVFVVGVSVWYGARREEVTIDAITVSGGETVSHEIIKEKAEGVLSGTYALLIPRRFSFLFPHDEIVAAVNSIPRVHDATVVRSSRNELSITYKEYTPYALWCSELPSASSTPSCIFVNEEGFAYADAPRLQGESLVRFVIEGRAPQKGTYVYDTETLRRYRAFADAFLVRRDVRLASVVETASGDLTLHGSNNLDLLIRKDADIQDIFEKIESIFSSDEFKDVPLDHYAYIDLRFGNKVFLKDKTAPVAEGSEESGVEGAAAVPPAEIHTTDAASSSTLLEQDESVGSSTRG